MKLYTILVEVFFLLLLFLGIAGRMQYFGGGVDFVSKSSNARMESPFICFLIAWKYDLLLLFIHSRIHLILLVDMREHFSRATKS